MRNTPWLRLVCASALAVAGAAGAVQALAAPSGWLNVDGSIRFIAGGGSVDWANSGPPGAACANGGVNLTGSGGLFNCGAPGAAGAPPIAPTLTATAAADPSIISAVFISDPISADTTACGGGDSSTISGANGDAINSYAVSTGPVPNKDDLSNVYAASHTRADNGHPELYFAAERLVNNGDSHIDFEFLQSTIARTAQCGGGLTGHRTEGDLLVAVDFTNGGALAGVSIYQWHCLAEPGPQPPDGTICDPVTVEHYQLITAPAAISVAVNAADVPCGGWICRDSTGVTSTVVTNDFVEGGIDLQGIAFAGCFNTFMPHTRTSGSFTAQLKDFTGPAGFSSCRNPVTTSNSAPGGTVLRGASVTDAVTVANGGAGFTPTGSITFFLCTPAQVAGSGCAGGAQVGSVKALVAGAATSDATAATNTAGKYCWRTAYSPDATSLGVYASASHTNATTECFTVIDPALPNTGAPAIRDAGWDPLAAGVVLVVLLPAMVWRRGRAWASLAVAAVLMAGPGALSEPTDAHGSTSIGHQAVTGVPAAPPPAVTRVHAGMPEPPTPPAFHPGWRLLIPSLGVDAPIESVGREAGGAVASPADLGGVGWFNGGPAPGQQGDAVLDGHYGVEQAGVFRALHLLRPGDDVYVIWPDGHSDHFTVATLETVDAGSHPVDLFSAGGPPRVSLITCAGAWLQSERTYSDRLIVTAVSA
ncbi:MAG TPA: sortase [Candidatus Dormibacteraeota bacterium]|nr:sortase [Candidatus Dormibacteraeota bacterium]